MSALEAAVAALIDRLADGTRDDDARDALLDDALHAQAKQVASYAKFLASETRRPGGHLPALPTDVFRYARVAAHAVEHDLRVFRTSGTTGSERGSHAFRSLALYDRAAYAAARRMLFPDRERMRLVILAPEEHEAPESSLSYMLARFGQWFAPLATGNLYVMRSGELDLQRFVQTLTQAERDAEPVALLGTSFAFVHAQDALGARQFSLPRGSRVMQTGGFKGRSRSIEPAEMLALLAARYGIDEAWIVQEYGMTELSSQLYETTLRDAALGARVGPRRLWTPSWVRARPIDPDTLLPVAEGATGLLRIDDLANLHSVCAVQTSDLARREPDGLVVLGRAPGAVVRGCSVGADDWLGARGGA